MRANASHVSGDPRIRIAVLDGPVDWNHSGFIGARLEFPRGQPAFDLRSPAAQHGTHVASIIFGQPGSAILGRAPLCTGIIIPVFGAAPDLRCTQLDLARAILTALDHGAHIINISGGQLVSDCDVDPDLTTALAACETQRVLVIAAAGNDGCSCNHVPACVPTVLVVGATDSGGAPHRLTNRGHAYRGHGLLAPGDGIVGAVPGAGTAQRTGTSFATAIASGTAACMLSERLAAGKTVDPLLVRAAMAGTMIPDNPAVSPAHRPSTQSNRPGNRGRADMTLSDSGTTADDFPMVHATSGRAPQFGIEQPQSIGPSEALSVAEVTASCADGKCGCGGAKDCGCGCGGARKALAESAPQLVYALGQIGYDFGSPARQDSIAQFNKGVWPKTDKLLLDYLMDEGQEDVERLIWVLKLDNTPIYALKPIGAFAPYGYTRILKAFAAQVGHRLPTDPKPKKGEDREPEKILLTAVPGYVAGTVKLMSGETVPILVPISRGITPWNGRKAYDDFLVEAKRRVEEDPSLAQRLDEMAGDEPHLREFFDDFRNLITRKYRNLGVSGRDRALNYAVTALYRVFEALDRVIGTKLMLDQIEVVKSVTCRNGSECHDVRLRMFIPSDITASLRVLQFTVDVSDPIPVHIGDVSAWSERPHS